MTSRLAPGGLQTLLGLKPDMTVLGKYLGGGLAFGAFGGTEAVMSVYDPRVPGYLPHSGTFNNNTLTMSTGWAGLAKVYTPEVATSFNATGDKFLARLQGITMGTKCAVIGKGTVITVHFTESGIRPENIRSRDDLASVSTELRELFWLEMMEEGYWIASRGTIALILGTPQEELDRFVGCVERFLQRHASLVGLSA
jgi:glutamate-1-semialdehyde 2,1-aminomutase